MPQPERIVLDGFSYLVLKRIDGAVAIELTDHERGIVVEAHFPAEGWTAFLKDAMAAEDGVVVTSPDVLRRLGI